MKISTMIITALIAVPLSVSVAFAERENHESYHDDIFGETLNSVERNQVNNGFSMTCFSDDYHDLDMSIDKHRHDR